MRVRVGENSAARISGVHLSLFFLLTYAMSWALWLPLVWWTPSGATRQVLLIAGTFGPSVAAALLILARGGRSGLGSVLAKQSKWRLPLTLWAMILFAPTVIVLTAFVIAQALGAPAGQWNDPGQIYLALPVLLYVVVFGGPLGEELGWRGFALPRLEQRIHPTAAVIVLGLLWGLWHLPLFWIEGTVQQQIPLVAYLAQITATSIVYGWLWNETRSLPAVIAIHAATNTTVGLLPVLPDSADSLIPLWTAISIAAVIALVLVFRTKGRLGYHSETTGDSVDRPGDTEPRAEGREQF